MIDATNRDKVCCSIVNQYLFDNVWNEPTSEYRINVHPQRYSEKSTTGSFRVVDANVYLPTATEPYFIWFMKYTDTNIGLQLNTGEWYDTATICNEWNTLIHTYVLNGNMLPKGCVYLRYNKSRSLVYIAIKKNAFIKCTDLANLDKVYLTIYYDSDNTKDIKVLSLHVDSTKRFRELQSSIDNIRFDINPDWLTEFRNGIEITSTTSSPTLIVGDYLDFIVDKNILFSFDIDLSSSHENPVFLSEKNKVWKQLIHIPRALNPDNKVITHNTCDFFVRNLDNTSVYGKYMHRVATTGRTVDQVTHNDMSIPLFVIDAYRDYLNTQNVGIHVVVRNHDKNNLLINDADYIKLLYTETHTDDDIIKFLTGNGYDKITWWQAAQLEQSKYVEMMFDSPDQITCQNSIANYIDALGYYSVVNLLCKKVVDTIVTDGFDGTLAFQLPLLFLGFTVIPLVYVNGKILSNDYYSYSTLIDTNICSITIDSSIYLKTNDKISVIFHLSSNNASYQFIPTADNVTITIPYSDPLVYRKISVATILNGVDKSSTYAYELCSAGGNIYNVVDNGDGTFNLVFNSSLISTEFIIENSKATYLKTYDLASYTDTGKNIVIPIETNISNVSDTNAPIFGYRNMNVYLNRKYLVKDIDYTINEVRDESGNLSFSELVVQTMDNFNEGSSDILTILYNVAELDENSKGYTIDNKLYDDTPVNLFFDNLTTVHVAGELVRNSNYHGTYTELTTEVKQGSIWEIRTAVPLVIKDFLNEYKKSQDLNRIAIMNTYFHDKYPSDPDVIVLEDKHRIYSIFMNTIIRAVINGDIVITADPDVNRFKELIKPYKYLQDIDICYRDDNDQRFVDYYPQYVNYEIDPSLKVAIDNYIMMLMPKNINPTMEVVY